MKFFVYTSDKDEFEFVEEASIDLFAAHEFDPISMKFVGIAIEAEDFGQAMRIYQNPACGLGEYMVSDEPNATATKRLIDKTKSSIADTFEDVQKKLKYMQCMLKMKLAAARLYEANTIFNEVSRDLYEMNKNQYDASPSDIFKKLVENTIELTIKYGDTKKSG